MDKSLLDTTPATNLLTLKEYIYVYPRLMTEYQKLGEDCSEMYFIEEQIQEHFIYIDSYKNARKRILDDGYKEKYGTYEDYHLMVRSFDIRVTSLKAIIEYLETKKAELGNPHKITIDKPDIIKTKVLFKDFFIDKVDIKTINIIQEKCKEYNDKEMAFLIYLLHQEYKIINYSMGSRTKSRKHFVLSLKGIEKRTSGIDILFEPSGVKLNDPHFLKDNDYKAVKTELNAIIPIK